jgi:alkanesulfonate monooxygenase SsuD/methylene tetrahydromethanopterin reductase-like flavin-dependent oxidoreductase (luciferase family)
MPISVGYLLPTRERIVRGEHETGPILELADHAEAVGVDSVWIGDSLLAKPRHEPLALLAAIAGRTKRMKMGTAVLLPMLRNPVLLAHQAATIDQISEGRLILGLGIARDIPAIRGEFQAAGVPFEKRIGLMLDQVRLCRALWSGEKIDWDGRWTVRGAELAPQPYSKGGPPLWGGGAAPGALRRAGRNFDGWFPSGPGGPEDWGACWKQVKAHAAAAGRAPDAVTGAAYVTVAVNDDSALAEAELNDYLAGYYLRPAEEIRAQQHCFGGNPEQVADWLGRFARAGATHICVRFTGSEDARQMEELVKIRDAIG